MKYCILLVGLFARFAPSLDAAEASNQAGLENDGEKIRALAAKLGSVEFDEREKARAAILAMGTNVLALIEEAVKTHKNDPEISQQLSSIRTALEAKATAEAQEALAKQIEKYREATDVSAAAASFQAILKKLCAYAPKTEAVLRARAYYQAGYCLYGMVKKIDHAKAEYRLPAELFEAAANYYEKARKADPNNKEIENDLIETNMYLENVRIYQKP